MNKMYIEWQGSIPWDVKLYIAVVKVPYPFHTVYRKNESDDWTYTGEDKQFEIAILTAWALDLRADKKR